MAPSSTGSRTRAADRRDEWSAILFGSIPGRAYRRGDGRPPDAQVDAAVELILASPTASSIPIARRPRLVRVELNDASSTTLGRPDDYRPTLAAALVRARLVLRTHAGPEWVRVVVRGRVDLAEEGRVHADREGRDGRQFSTLWIWEPLPGWAG